MVESYEGFTDDEVALDEEIKRLELVGENIWRHLEQVRSSLDALRSQVKRLANRKAPISRLPHEILGFIFLKCCNSRREFRSLLLSHISHHWRVVAINTPSLWDCIDIKTTQSPELLEIYVIRSKARLVTVRLTLVDSFTGLEDLHQDHSKIIQSNIHHIASLEIREQKKKGRKTADILLALGASQASNLQKLIVPNGKFGYPLVVPILNGGAPKLTHIEINTYLISHFHPPLSALEYLRISWHRKDLDFHTFCTMISNSPRLRCLVIDGDIVSFDQEGDLGPISAPALREIDINAPVEPEFMKIFVAFYTSHIERLRIVRASQYHLEVFTESYHSPLYSGLSKLSRVDKLELVAVHPDLEFLKIFNKTRHLTLTNTSDDLFDYCHLLTASHSQDDGNVPLMPLLQTLSIYFLATEDLKGLCDMIASRIGAGIPITTLRLTLYDDTDDNTTSGTQIQWLRDHLEVKISRVDAHEN